MKVCYTALFSDYEELKEPTVITPGWRYICFTDQDLTSPVWEIVHENIIDNNPRRTARLFKIMGWFDWAESIWVDASFQINVNLNEWWDRYYKLPFNAPRHPLRTCVYREIVHCIVGSRGETELLVQQEADYKEAGVPEHNNRIIASGMLLRSNEPDNIEMHRLWWNEVCKYSTRDQVAFARVSIGYEINTFVWDYSQSKEFRYIRHKHLRQ